MKDYCVYKHTSPSGKVYIGITCQNPLKRWDNGNGYRNNKYFSLAIKKYGWNNFMHEILVSNLSKAQAEKEEVKLIALYKSNKSDFGYNIQNGGSSAGKMDENTKIKIGNSNRNKIRTLEFKKQISERQKGRKLTESQKEKISRAVKESWTLTRREQYADRISGCNNINYGKKFTEEEIRNLQEKCRGRNSILSKKVGQYDVDNNLIEIFDSAREAGRNGFTTQAITAVCRGEKHTHKGFIWRYIEENGICKI